MLVESGTMEVEMETLKCNQVISMECVSESRNNGGSAGDVGDGTGLWS